MSATSSWDAYEGGEAAAPDPIWIDDADWTEADIPRRPWIAPGYLLRGAVTLLVGPPSAMKSSLALSWACALGLDRPFGGFAPRASANTLIYNVEDDQTEQQRRLSAVLRHFGATPANIRGKVVRTGPRGIGTLLTRDGSGLICFTPALDKLKEAIIAFRTDALVLDPLAELHDAEENDNTALRVVIAAFRTLAIEHDVAVVILHHTRKGSAGSPGDPDTARGASAIIGAVRSAFTLTTMTEADAAAFGMPADVKARSQYVRLDSSKQNYAALGDAEWFAKVPVILENGEAVAAAAPWAPPSAKQASQADLAAIAGAIERGTPSGEPWSPKLSSDDRSVRALLETHGFAGAEAQKKVLKRLVDECAVVTSRYRNRHRDPAGGLRIGDLPEAD